MSVIVGINADVVEDEKPRQSLYLDYLDWITAAGGTPLILPAQASSLTLLDHVDAILLTGGDDYRVGNGASEPADFVAVAERRESFDVKLAEAALQMDLPLIAVCGGFQLVTLVAGGAIFGDLATEYPGSEEAASGASAFGDGAFGDMPTPANSGLVHHRRESSELPLARHRVRWSDADDAPTAMGQGRDGADIAAGEYETNSHHHQAVRRLPASWKPLAIAEDGVIEAGFGSGCFQVGVQWHPEKDRESYLSRRIALALIQSATLRERA